MMNIISLSLLLVALAFYASEVASFSAPPSPTTKKQSHLLRAATTTEAAVTTSAALETHVVVGCFGRLADRAFVVAPSDVEGTAASGYEFGVLESGRPKWMCTYTLRKGATQGGGADMTHVPTWCSVLFGDDGDGDAVLTKEKLAAILRSADTKFEMPLGAPPGAKNKASEPLSETECEDATNRLWEILGGGEELSKEAASEGLAAAASTFGSKSDSMTYSVFAKAMAQTIL